MKNLLTQQKTKEKNQKINEYDIDKKLDLGDLMKNLPIEIGDGEKKSNN